MGIEFFLAGWGVTFTIYVVLQSIAALSTRGKRRLLVLLPAPFMLAVLLWTVFAYRSDSPGLWPIFMIFSSLAAIIAVITLWVTMRVAQNREAAARIE